MPCVYLPGPAPAVTVANRYKQKKENSTVKYTAEYRPINK